jgi:hypothetical protein
LDADTVDGYQGSALLNVLSIAYGASGSFRLLDGTTTLLIQWPETSDWANVGSGSTGRVRWTFPTAYSAAPVVFGGYHESFYDPSSNKVMVARGHSYTATSTYIELPINYSTGGDSYYFDRVGTPFVLGAI